MVLSKMTAPTDRFISLRVKLLIGFTMVFSIVFAGAYYWFYTYASNRAMQRVGDDLVDTLEGAIAGIDGNEFEQLATVDVPQGQDLPIAEPLYWQHQEWLNKVHKIEPRANPYTFVRGEQPYEVLWVGDIFRIIRRPSMTYFRDSYVANPTETNLYHGLTELTVTMMPYSDEWGSWVSAYGPIRNSEGEIVGGVGIDFNADYVKQVQRGIRNSMAISFTLTYSSLFVLVYIFSGVFTNPIVSLTKAAEQIGEGDYEQNLTCFQARQLPDEISSLAEVFEIMVGKVRRREETLKQQVAELKIEIDQAKRDRQVQEIVDSDFFQDLQTKARKLRHRTPPAASE